MALKPQETRCPIAGYVNTYADIECAEYCLAGAFDNPAVLAGDSGGVAFCASDWRQGRRYSGAAF